MRLTTITLVLGAALLAQAFGRSGVDPCTFFSKSEIESAFGHPYGPPMKGSTMAGPTCMFYSRNTGTISIRAGEVVTRAQFDSLRTALGDKAEPVNGVGETAFYPDRTFLRPQQGTTARRQREWRADSAVARRAHQTRQARRTTAPSPD